jgi:hypothetical protein
MRKSKGLVMRACSLGIQTQFHWSSGPPACFPSCGTWVQSPGAYLCETGILLLALSRYISDFFWGGGGGNSQMIRPAVPMYPRRKHWRTLWIFVIVT